MKNSIKKLLIIFFLIGCPEMAFSMQPLNNNYPTAAQQKVGLWRKYIFNPATAFYNRFFRTSKTPKAASTELVNDMQEIIAYNLSAYEILLALEFSNEAPFLKNKLIPSSTLKNIIKQLPAKLSTFLRNFPAGSMDESESELLESYLLAVLKQVYFVKLTTQKTDKKLKKQGLTILDGLLVNLESVLKKSYNSKIVNEMIRDYDNQMTMQIMLAGTY